jgi:predicted SnoaL-like aldol condensation-catalyzing enzyme
MIRFARLAAVALALATSLPLMAGKTEERNKALAESFVREVYNERKLDRIPHYVGESFVDRSPGAPADAKGPAFVRKQADASFAITPDLKFVNERMVAEGDLVAIHWTATGNSVPPGGTTATKPTKISGISIFRYEKGKIVESWDIVDRLALFRQLGFTITPPPKAE